MPHQCQLLVIILKDLTMCSLRSILRKTLNVSTMWMKKAFKQNMHHHISAGKSTPAITSSRSATTTILGCGNALGTMMPPFYIFKDKQFSSDLLKGALTGSQGIVTDNGWSNALAFQEFLKSHFLKYVQRSSNDQTVLMSDGHRSHIIIPVLEWVVAHNIELFVLPAHTSHLLQPLDVACFGPLQRIYNSECHKFIRSNPYSNITRYHIAELSSKAYEHALSTPNLKSAFKSTGIFPFDPSTIESEKLTPATAYHQSSSSTIFTTTPVLNGPVAFFNEQKEIISHKQIVEKKQNNTLSKVTSGTLITEPKIVQTIRDHVNSNKTSSKRKCEEAANKSSKKQIKPSITKPVPGPTGLQAIFVSDSDSDSGDNQ